MIYEKTNDFYLQKINIINVEGTRFDFFDKICKDKKVLHIGCADAMSFGIGHNLHAKLMNVAKNIHGMDIDTNDLQQLKNMCPGTYFNSLKECDKEYDIILVPEVLEHILNTKDFLDEIFSIASKEVLITVPNILHYTKEMAQSETYSLEIVHPDHKYWFSPYTLYNITKPYIKNEHNCTMYYLDKKSMVAILIKGENYDRLVE
jgi:2-polyprenyl-3-methyl-5-hydroxy-6-metoxy-1,4-benzoquinol methylase